MISCACFRSKRAWIATIGSCCLGAALGPYWYSLGQPDPFRVDCNFELQFGRGSGWHGLDLLRIDSAGKASYEYQTGYEMWCRKRFVVDEKRLVKLRESIGALNPCGMARAYHGNVVDGTQWVMLVRIDGKSKSVYFDNNFPEPIRKFSDFVDRTILEPLADPVEPEIVPARHHRKHEKEIWERIR